MIGLNDSQSSQPEKNYILEPRGWDDTSCDLWCHVVRKLLVPLRSRSIYILNIYIYREYSTHSSSHCSLLTDGRRRAPPRLHAEATLQKLTMSGCCRDASWETAEVDPVWCHGNMADPSYQNMLTPSQRAVGQNTDTNHMQQYINICISNITVHFITLHYIITLNICLMLYEGSL